LQSNPTGNRARETGAGISSREPDFGRSKPLATAFIAHLATSENKMALSQSLLGGGGGAHTQPSLPLLPAHLQSDTHITAHLASRFHVQLPTARLSSHALVSINTYTSSTKGIDGGKEGSAMAGAEDMAERALIRLGHRSENQAVLFLSVYPSCPPSPVSRAVWAMLYVASTVVNLFCVIK
jgi:chitin synthase